MTFTELAKRYVAAGCPNRSGERRGEAQAALECRNLARLKPHFSRIPLLKISIRHCAEYGAANSTRQRAADIELQTLANLFWFAVMEGICAANPILNRARTRKSKDVKHCRESMPRNADELHRVARELLSRPESEAVGWQMLFEAFTGCRTSEVLAMRRDARAKGEPGYVENSWLYVRRQKRGGQPYVKIDADLNALISAHFDWHFRRSAGGWYPSICPWYFPGKSIALPLNRNTLTTALRTLCPKLGIPTITSHGLRAYFVTMKRSQGVSDEQVAALVGIASVDLIQSTYGDLPASWSGGEPLTLMPRNGPPAWVAEKREEAA